MQKSKKILIPLLIVISILSAIFTGTNILLRNNTQAAVGDSVLANKSLLSDPLFYCIDHGKYYYNTTTYIEVDSTYASFEEAYFIMNQEKTDEDRHKNNNIIARMMWLLNDRDSSNRAEIANNLTAQEQKLIQDSQIIKNTRDYSVSIESEALDNGQKYVDTTVAGYGPFQITYPTYTDGKPLSIDNNPITNSDYEAKYLVQGNTNAVKIYVNGQALTWLPQSGVDFYLTEADGIKPGEENTISIQYNGKSFDYSGITKTQYTPQTRVYRDAYCDTCGQSVTKYILEGIMVGGTSYNRYDYVHGVMSQGLIGGTVYRRTYPGAVLVEDEDWNMSIWEIEHTEECDEQHIEDRELIVNEPYVILDNQQDCILFSRMPSLIPFTTTDQITFWPGKPDIDIDFEKKDFKTNTYVEGAQFNVTVSGGTIAEGGSTFTTGTSSQHLKFRPSAGSSQVIVTFTETQAPGKYIQLADPVVITYNWNSSTKRWQSSYDGTLPTGKEQILVTLGNSITSNSVRSTADCKDPFTIIVENRRRVELTLNKVGPDGTSLDGAVFEVSIINGSFVFKDGRTGNTFVTGSGDNTILVAPEAGKTSFTVRYTENSAPNAQYIKLQDPIEITYTLQADGSWKPTQTALDLSTGNEHIAINAIGTEDYQFQVVAENRKKVEIDIEKYGQDGTRNLVGAKFNIKLSNAVFDDGTDETTLTTTSNSSANKIIVSPLNKNNFTVTYTETEAPYKYIALRRPFTITYSWDATNSKWTPSYNGTLDVGEILKVENESGDSYKFISTVENRRKVEVRLDKTDPEWNSISGAKFTVSVENGTYEFVNTSLTNPFEANPSIDNTILVEPNAGVTSFKVRYHEEAPAPKGFALLKDDVVIEYRTTDGGKTWSPVSANTTLATGGERIKTNENGDRFTYKIQAENRRKIMIDLSKLDTENKVLANRKFDLTVANGTFEDTEGITNGRTSGTITTKTDGTMHIEIIPNGKARVTLTLKEQHTDEYYSDLDDISIEFEYVEATGDWTASVKQPSTIKKVPNTGKNQVAITGKTDFKLEIINIAKFTDLELLKVNKQDNSEAIEGVTFRVELQNAQSVSKGRSFTVTTGADGKFRTGEIQIDKPSQDVVIKITEVSTPAGLDGKVKFLNKDQTVTLTLKHLDSRVTTDNDLLTATYDTSKDKNTISVKLENEIAIDLSGMVWEDVQHGDKPVIAPNGYREGDESGMAGIIVKLFNANGTPAKDFEGCEIAQQITGADGSYKFENLPASINGNIRYYVAFSYDGINFITVEKHATGSTAETDSDVDEVNRTAFNNRFKTITKGQSNDGTTLEYDYSKEPMLITKASNGTVLSKYEMTAKTDNTYGQITTHIDMGLVAKEVDLAAVTELENAIVAINGKVQTYPYSDLTTGELDLDKLQAENVIYNLYLYDSDYNYRIGDYKLDAVRRDTLTVNEDAGYMNSLMAQRRNDGELAVYLSYQIAVSNRSSKPSTVNYLSYYYDLNYEPVALIKLNRDGTENMIYNFQDLIASNPSLTPSKVDMDGDGTPDKYLMKFAINQHVEEFINENFEIVFNVKLNELDLNNRVAECNNWVEIVSYSTDEGGLVDKNSAPDNILDGVDRRKENDTDDATTLRIQLNGLNREISGYVFEDNKTSTEPGKYNIGNGYYDAGEPKVDDVIVQLIEIKDVTIGSTTYKLEYIWQETTTGSDEISYVTMDGNSKSTYKIDNRVTGEYKFNKNIIPGNYIVRFIYGDGTYWDKAVNTQNLIKYNGQDYKSTVSLNYADADFIQNAYLPDESMAVDNEARRFEEMAYATSVTDTNALIIDSKEKLANTWMCADTALVDMEISDYPNQPNDANLKSRVDPYSINFGLTKRPEMALEIEKHVTELTITQSGSAGNLVEAKTDISNYDDEYSLDVAIDQNSGGVIATKTDKNANSRGSWIVQTQTSKLTGNEIDIGYTYVIRNVGDLDYIGNSAVGQNYSTLAQQIKSSKSKANSGYVIGTYLGTAYYSGDTNGNTNVELNVKVEDYLGSGLNKLSLNGGNFTTVETTEKKVWNISGDETTEKDVEVVRTNNTYRISGERPVTFEQNVKNSSINTTGVNKEYRFRSYSAQLISDDGKNINSKTGTIVKGLKSSVPNTTKVQSYAPESVVRLNLDEGDTQVFAAEPSEFVAETVIITMDTGGTDPETKSVESNTLRIAEIVAGSMAIIAVGLVLIKKFAIKK